MATVSYYELSEAADRDVEGIFDFAEQAYGLEQAVDYTLALEMIFDQLVSNPEMGIRRNEIQEGLRSFPKAQHVIFYRILSDRIRMVRVLHGRRDLPKQF